MQKEKIEWMVIGAGPAGIAAIGKLLDQGVSPVKIGWMDPHFQVGDLGRKWQQVSSNTQVDLFLRFLKGCDSFAYGKRTKPFAIDRMDPQETCLLQHIVEPLQWISEGLKQRVKVFHEVALALNLKDQEWKITTPERTLAAKNVILAVGSEEKSLLHPGKEVLSLEIALNPNQLKQAVNKKERIGVFGSSHSAVLVLANLVQLQVQEVVNFYRTPHRYAIPFEDWILFDNTGLKGFAAEWAKKNLDGTHPRCLRRMLISDHAFEEALALCSKVIYAVGFSRRKTPVLEQFETMEYNDKTGIIAPGLFGVGIAFPEARYDPLMNLEYRVGLWKFMEYLDMILPIWIQYANK